MLHHLTSRKLTVFAHSIVDNPWRLNCKNLADLERDIRRNLGRIPRNVDLVVGVPRSGMLPATILSQLLNAPLATLDEYLSGTISSTGNRPINKSAGGLTLIVDDSVCSGQEMRRVRKRVNDARKSNVVYSCVYGTDGSNAGTDIELERVRHPRIFSWNIMNSWILEHACCDIDGVLCVDPTDSQNDDSQCYQEFVDTVEPLNLPLVRIRRLVTCRLEKYRRATEHWLGDHNILFDNLVMADGITATERRNAKKFNHAEFKARVYKQDDDAVMFIESCPNQAHSIARLSGKWVFCFTTGEFIAPSFLRYQTRGTLHVARRIGRKLTAPQQTLRQLIQYVR